MTSRLCLYCAVLGFALVRAAAAQPMTFQGLGHLGPPQPPPNEMISLAYAISGDGSTVAGQSRIMGGPIALAAGFRWTQATGMTFVTSTKSEVYGEARGASFDGSVIVGSTSAVPGIGYRWTDATGPVPIGPRPGASFCNPTAVSWSGNVIVGESGNHAFRWTPETGTVGLGHIPGGTSSTAQAVSPDGSVVVGYAITPTAQPAIRWTAAQGLVALGSEPGWSQPRATAVAADGRAFGYVQSQSLGQRAIMWDLSGHPTDLGAGRITGCTPDGNVLVGFSNLGPTIWDTSGPKSVAAILGAVVPAGWFLASVQAVSADGRTITGIGGNPFGQTESWVATIPEPGVAVLLAMFFGAARRRSPPATTTA